MRNYSIAKLIVLKMFINTVKTAATKTATITAIKISVYHIYMNAKPVPICLHMLRQQQKIKNIFAWPNFCILLILSQVYI